MRGEARGDGRAALRGELKRRLGVRRGSTTRSALVGWYVAISGMDVGVDAPGGSMEEPRGVKEPGGGMEEEAADAGARGSTMGRGGGTWGSATEVMRRDASGELNFGMLDCM